jgi:serine/threonine protein kinase/tetratricopeptide (TPR) repeat protein
MSGSASNGGGLGPLADEFLERCRRGERPALTEYTAAHPELAEQIRELFPALVMLEDVRPGPPGLAGTPPDTGPPRRLGEYRILREIGRGGMGVVYEAEQVSLGRRVALKVLPPGTLGDARQVERFQREARAAARLHHTNIVPVFAVGEEGGTHYYVMQYIEGRPLDEVLAELRRLRDETARRGVPGAAADTSATEVPPGDGAPAGGPSSASLARSLCYGPFHPAQSPDVPTSLSAGPHLRAGAVQSSGLLCDSQRPFAKRLAHLGVQVAEALEYASDQGILHRDIKPSNLLLDVWGTVWLTDFGLAKATGTPDLTRPGDLRGTLRYLAPERFEGRADVRSDIYALGLTLYEVLTLRPAFCGRDQAELTHRITTAEPPRLDRIDPHLPRDLVTIVHKAIGKDPADRYQTPAALADDLRRFLDDRPIVARRAGLSEQAWRWCRRNPSTAGLLAALLALVLLGTGGWVWVERQQAERRGRARAAAEAALAQVPGLRQQGRWPEAEAVLTQGRSRLDDAGSDDLRRRLARAEEDLRLATALEQVRLTPAIEGGRLDYRGMAAAYAHAFGQAGLDSWGDEGAMAARIRASDLRPQLVMALDHWAYVADALGDRRSMARLLGLARRVDPDPRWGDRFRAPGVWGDPEALRRLAAEAQERLAGEASEGGPPTALLTLLARKLGQQEGQAEPLLRAAQRRHPEDFWLNYALGEALRERKPAEAVGFYRAALATRPTVAVVYAEVGMALYRQRHFDEAVLALRKAIELRPNAAPYQHNLGLCLRDQGRADEAVAAYRRAIQLDPKGAPAHHGLGLCLQDQGQLDEAMAEYRRAIELDPKGAPAHVQLGMVLRARGCTEEAIAAFGEAVQLDPGGALAHAALVDELLRRGHFAEARAAAQRGLDVLPGDEPRRPALRHKREQSERMLALDAKLPALLQGEGRPAAAADQLDLARLCRDGGRLYAAARLYAAVLAARPALADDLGSANRYDAACAAARAAADRGSDEARLGELERAGLRRQALDWLRADLMLRAKLLRGGKSVAAALKTWQTADDLAGVRDPAPLAKLPAAECKEWRRLWADVAALLAADPLEPAQALIARRAWGRAAECYARVLKRGPTDDGHFWFEHAALLLLSGDRPGYARACARMVERCGTKAPDLRAYHVARACTLAGGAVAEASLPGRLAETELKDHAGDFWSLTEQGALHYRAGRFREAVPLFEQSLRADPKSGRAVLNWLWLALAHQRLGQAAEARRWLGKAQAWLDRYSDGMPARAEQGLGLHLHNWLEAHVLRREAEALLGTGPARPK